MAGGLREVILPLNLLSKIQCLCLGSSKQEKPVAGGRGPKEGCEPAPSRSSGWETWGCSARGREGWRLQTLKLPSSTYQWFIEKRESSFLHISDRVQGNGFKLKEDAFRWDTRRKYFNVRVVRHQYRLPREVLDAPGGWKCSRPGEMGLWATWSCRWYLCLW